MKILNVAVYLIIFQILVFQVLGTEENKTNDDNRGDSIRIKSEEDTYSKLLNLNDVNDVNDDQNNLMKQLEKFLEDEKVINSNGKIVNEENLNLENEFTMKATYLKVFSKIIFIILVVILYD